jgi:hypothetical protein
MADRDEESVGSGEVSPGDDAGEAGAEVAQEGEEEEEDDDVENEYDDDDDDDESVKAYPYHKYTYHTIGEFQDEDEDSAPHYVVMDGDDDETISRLFDPDNELPVNLRHDNQAGMEVPTKISNLSYVQSNEGKGGWTCLHCRFTCRGAFMATKLKAHLAKIAFCDVQTCIATDVPTNLMTMYRQQWQQYLEKKYNKKRKAEASVEESEQCEEAAVVKMVEVGISKDALN